jgi:hypothetical protein
MGGFPRKTTGVRTLLSYSLDSPPLTVVVSPHNKNQWGDWE